MKRSLYGVIQGMQAYPLGPGENVSALRATQNGVRNDGSGFIGSYAQRIAPVNHK
jgi:hypothetical protein